MFNGTGWGPYTPRSAPYTGSGDLAIGWDSRPGQRLGLGYDADWPA